MSAGVISPDITRLAPVAAAAGVDAVKAKPGHLRFEALGKIYHSRMGNVEALKDISLDIAPGEIYGIIGRSGAGKSSLLRTINRLEAPTTGRVLVDGDDIARLDEVGLVTLRRRVGMIFQHFNLLSARTVRENVALPLIVAGVAKGEIRRRTDEVLALVGLSGKGDTYPSRLSGGQKQRVGVARALISRPEILLCDEATSALDPETTLSILELLRDINRKLGLTIVLITHEMSVVREICNRVLVLEGGAVAEEGPVWKVFGTPRHDATRALLAPLQRELPPELTVKLRSDARNPRDRAVIGISYAGAASPDLQALAGAAKGAVELLSASVDRIQGHAVGRIVLALAPGAKPAALIAQHPSAKVIGYVSADD